jgi:hypothetical protein
MTSTLATDPRAGLEFVRRTLFKLEGGDDGTEHGGCAVDDLADFAAVVLVLTDPEKPADMTLPGIREALHRMAMKAQNAAGRIDAAHRGMSLIARVGIGRFLICADEAEKAARLIAGDADA